MLPTVADVLALDVLRQGRCQLVAGAEAVNNPVRWVHVSELVDIAHLLRGGELVLTTGVALPDSPAGLAGYVRDLARVGTAGLIVELCRRFPMGLPDAIVQAAQTHRLPVAVLQREVAFVAVTEAVHSRIIDVQLEELRRSETLHATFTELSLRGATAAEVLRSVALLASAPVVLEDLAHQVLEVNSAGRPVDGVLHGWEDRSRAAVCQQRIGYAAGPGLLVSRVGAHGDDWGRLVLICDDPPAGWHRMLLERATTALALGRLIERDLASVVRQAERTLLSSILDHSRPVSEIVAHADGLGVPLTGRQLVGLTIDINRTGSQVAVSIPTATRALVGSLARAARQAECAVLVGVLSEGEISALVSLDAAADVDRSLEVVSAAVTGATPVAAVLAAGSTGYDVGEARRSLLESRQVAAVAWTLPSRPFYRLADLGVRGLIHLMRDDPRLQSFVERQLGPLLNAKPHDQSRLLDTLTAYLEAGGKKTAAANLAHVSRSVFYDRLARVQDLLGVNLADAEQTTSLHLATLALKDFRASRR